MEQQSGSDDSKDISHESTPSDVLIPKAVAETSSEGLASNIGPETGLEKKLESPSPEAKTSGISQKPGSSTSIPTSPEGYKGKFLYNYTQYQIAAKRHPVKSSGPIRSGSEKRTTKQSSEWISENLLDASQETKQHSPKKPRHKSSGDISQVPGFSVRPIIVEQPNKETSKRKIEKPDPLVLEKERVTNTQEIKTTRTALKKQRNVSAVITDFEPHLLLLEKTLEEIKHFWKRIFALADVYDTATSVAWIQLGRAGPARPRPSFQKQEKEEGIAAVLSSLAIVLLRPDLSERLRQYCYRATWPEDSDLFENARCLDVKSYELNSKINKGILEILCSISETTSEIQSFVRSSSEEDYSLEILGYFISTHALEKEFRNLHVAFTSAEYDILNWAMPKREIQVMRFLRFYGKNIELANKLLEIALLFFNLLIKYQTLNYEFAKTLPDHLGRILQNKYIPKAPMTKSSTE